MAHERIPDATGEKANLWATIGPAGPPGYILSGHTDVVPVDGQTWTNDPFRLTARGGRLYGRGATDMKGFSPCCLAAVPEMARAARRPIHLAFSYDEEVGCVGVRRHDRASRRAPVEAAACFVGEPTSMDVVIGHKGKRSFRVEVRGRTCHSSLAPQGVNAVEYAARLIAKIREMADRLARDGRATSSTTCLSRPPTSAWCAGGTALNIVPDALQLRVRVPPIAADDLDALTGEVDGLSRASVLEPEMQAVAPAAGIAFEVMSAFPGSTRHPRAEVVALAKALAGRNGHSKVAYGTEAGLFAQAGIPTVVIGPGSIEQAHKADEFIAAERARGLRRLPRPAHRALPGVSGALICSQRCIALLRRYVLRAHIARTGVRFMTT